jgi:tetratricopeptide (TPR) repeat protein
MDHDQIRSSIVGLLRAGQLDQAETLCLEIIATRPNDPDALHRLGAIALLRNETEGAIRYFEKALAIAPNAAQLHLNMGAALERIGRRIEAVERLRRAIELRNDYPEAYYNLGIALEGLGRIDEAIDCFKRAVALNPAYADAENNLGQALELRGRTSEATACYVRAIQADPRCVGAHVNLGTQALGDGNFTLAASEYERAIELAPSLSSARWNRSMLFLLRGDFERGWKEYESRWETGQFPRLVFKQSRWNGEPLGAHIILINAEQGFGDTIQFVRYAALVKEREKKARVVVECQASLVKLLSTCLGIDQLVPAGEPLPDFDVHVPLMSLPLVFDTRLETIPARVSYLFADQSLVDAWRAKLSSIDGFRIGVNWHGREGHRTAWQRDLPIGEVLSMAEIPDVRLISLQKGAGQRPLSESSDGWPIHYLGDDVDTAHGAFMDTAAIMKNLDLVITSDTSVAHLAGALGVRVWVALPFVPDWRWLLERSDSPWYPTMRLFRQKSRGDWAGVFEEIKEALAELAGAKGK